VSLAWNASDCSTAGNRPGGASLETVSCCPGAVSGIARAGCGTVAGVPLTIVRIASLPADGGINPYLELYHAALASRGVHWVGGFEATPAWIRRNGDRVDAVQFHWGLENIWRGRRAQGGRAAWIGRLRRRGAAAGCRGLAAFLDAAHERGIRILWTCHELEPHEPDGVLDEEGYGLVAARADLLVCHSQAAAAACAQRYAPQGRIVVAPHGSFVPAYPAPRERSEVRQGLQVQAHETLLVCAGYVRDYKGFDLACAAMAQLPGTTRLLIAGAAKRLDLAGFEQTVAAAPRTQWSNCRLSAQEYVDLLHASDLVLLPYRHSTCSGALVAALGFGNGVVAADLPVFREMLADSPLAASLFAPGEAGSLAGAVRDQLQIPRQARARACAARCESWSWTKLADTVCQGLFGGSLAPAGGQQPLRAAKP